MRTKVTIFTALSSFLVVLGVIALMGNVDFESFLEKNFKNEITIDNPKKPYPPDEAEANGDVVDLFMDIKNFEQFEMFIENISNGVEDEVRITSYTDEGDPIFENLIFDGEKIQFLYDNTQDNYAGSGKGVRNTTCSNIDRITMEDGVEYRLSKCSSNVGDIFSLNVFQNHENKVSEDEAEKAREIVWEYIQHELDGLNGKATWDKAEVKKEKYDHDRYVEGIYNGADIFIVSLSEEVVSSPHFLVNQELTKVIGVMEGS